MSSNNDQTTAISMQIALLVMGALFFAAVGLAVAGVAALLITVAAIFAWNRPKRFGPIIMTPHKAHGIVGHGIGLAIGSPLGIVAVQYFTGKPISWGTVPLLALGGYIVAALLVFKFGADQDEEPEVQAPVQAPMRVIESTPHAPAPVHQPRFASWNDEEELK